MPCGLQWPYMNITIDTTNTVPKRRSTKVVAVRLGSGVADSRIACAEEPSPSKLLRITPSAMEVAKAPKSLGPMLRARMINVKACIALAAMRAIKKPLKRPTAAREKRSLRVRFKNIDLI